MKVYVTIDKISGQRNDIIFNIQKKKLNKIFIL